MPESRLLTTGLQLLGLQLLPPPQLPHLGLTNPSKTRVTGCRSFYGGGGGRAWQPQQLPRPLPPLLPTTGLRKLTGADLTGGGQVWSLTYHSQIRLLFKNDHISGPGRAPPKSLLVSLWFRECDANGTLLRSMKGISSLSKTFTGQDSKVANKKC